MIWIIASIPFWLLAAFFLFAAGSAIIATFDDSISQEKFNQGIDVGIMFFAASGIVALIAAKICA